MPEAASPSAPAVGVPVLVVSDARVVRELLTSALHAQESITVLGAVSSTADLAEELHGRAPAVVLWDGSNRRPLPAHLDALVTGGLVRGVVIFAPRHVAEAVDEFRHGRCHGLVEAGADLETIVSAIEAVARGEVCVSPSLVAEFVRHGHPGEVLRNAALTPREREVAVLIAEGLGDVEIASRLHVRVGTVKSHVHHVLHKAGLRRRIDIVVALLRDRAR